MSLVLEKGGNLNLTKDNAGLTGIKVGLGWDVRTTAGAQFDLDSMALLLGADGKVASPGDSGLLYYASPRNGGGKPSLLGDALVHSGDNLTGAGAGDDEVVTIDFSKIPANISSIKFLICIFKANERNQNFGQVQKAYCNVYDPAGNKLVNFDLTEDMATCTTVEVGEAYRKDADWKFKNIGQGYKEYFPTILARYGVN